MLDRVKGPGGSKQSSTCSIQGQDNVHPTLLSFDQIKIPKISMVVDTLLFSASHPCHVSLCSRQASGSLSRFSLDAGGPPEPRYLGIVTGWHRRACATFVLSTSRKSSNHFACPPLLLSTAQVLRQGTIINLAEHSCKSAAGRRHRG